METVTQREKARDTELGGLEGEEEEGLTGDQELSEGRHHHHCSYCSISQPTRAALASPRWRYPKGPYTTPGQRSCDRRGGGGGKEGRDPAPAAGEGELINTKEKVWRTAPEGPRGRPSVCLYKKH